MKKLSVKMVVALIAVFFSVTTLLRILALLVGRYPTMDGSNYDNAFIGGIIAGFLSLTIFAAIVNRFFVRRIRKLDSAVKEIESGRYDIEVDIKGKDEISALAGNINQMARELRANEYLSKNFVRNFSHEMKTPMSSIKGYAELIAAEKTTKEEAEEYSKHISGQIDKLSSLSKSMLQLSLLDNTEHVIKNDVFSVDEQIRNILQLMQPEWEKKNIEFDLELDEVEITGNRELTRQIWQNLISNAVKFSDDGGSVRIQLFKTDGIHFEIQDFGQGISEESKAKIFNQFYVADKSRNKSGSGLGLSIVQKIIEKLGGSISFISKMDRGTTFYVTLD